VAYGRERAANVGTATKYEQFNTNVSPRAYLSKSELGRYNEYSSQYKNAPMHKDWGRRQRKRAEAGLSGLYGQAQSNAMDAYADYRERIGAGSSKGTILGRGDAVLAGPGWDSPDQAPAAAPISTPQYFGGESSMGDVAQSLGSSRPSRMGGQWQSPMRSMRGGGREEGDGPLGGLFSSRRNRGKRSSRRGGGSMFGSGRMSQRFGGGF